LGCTARTLNLLRLTGGPSAQGYKYAIRLPGNLVLEQNIGWLLTRPVGRPPHDVRCYHASFTYQAGSWSKPRDSGFGAWQAPPPGKPLLFVGRILPDTFHFVK
jgi:hypothetical protein